MLAGPSRLKAEYRSSSLTCIIIVKKIAKVHLSNIVKKAKHMNFIYLMRILSKEN